MGKQKNLQKKGKGNDLRRALSSDSSDTEEQNDTLQNETFEGKIQKGQQVLLYQNPISKILSRGNSIDKTWNNSDDAINGGSADSGSDQHPEARNLTLWVGNIPDGYTSSNKLLLRVFRPYGTVVSLTVRKKPSSDPAAYKSWALVTYLDTSGFEAALAANTVVEGADGQVVALVTKVADISGELQKSGTSTLADIWSTQNKTASDVARGYIETMEPRAHKALQRFLSEMPTDQSVDVEDDDDDVINFTDSDISDLVYAFMACDLTSSGEIDARELQAVLTVFGARRQIDSVRMLFEKIDADGGGTLDEAEVRGALEELTGGVMNNSVFRAVFTKMDPDGDGQVTTEEFEGWWETVDDVCGLSKSTAMNWARQLRLQQVIDIINRTIKEFSSDDTERALAIRSSTRLARAIGASTVEQASKYAIGFSFAPKITRRIVKNPIFSKPKAAISTQLRSTQVQKNDRQLERSRTKADVKSTPQFAESRLNFPQFVYMMNAGIIDEFIPDGNWRTGAAHMRNLRAAFDTADVDGSGEVGVSAVICLFYKTLY